MCMLGFGTRRVSWVISPGKKNIQQDILHLTPCGFCILTTFDFDVGLSVKMDAHLVYLIAGS